MRDSTSLRRLVGRLEFALESRFQLLPDRLDRTIYLCHPRLTVSNLVVQRMKSSEIDRNARR